MRIEPMVGALGAEILDIDLSAPLPQDTFMTVRRALFDYQVLVFRDQRLTLDQHKSFARQFGPLHVHPYILAKPLDGHPEVLRVIKEKDDRRVFGEKWHSDVTFLERPVLGSVLYAIDTPSKGGDTLFANMYMAHDTLSDAMRAMLAGLTAIHETAVPEVETATGRVVEPMRLVNRSREHPVLLVHPETGRTLLYVNSTYTTHFKGMTVEESRPLLEFLCQHATQAAFTCRVRWAPGTVTFWDNRSTQHLPINDYHGERREMHRVTVET
jgi:taurine dioxygenase